MADLLYVQYIACANEAAIVMNFSIQWLANDTQWNTTEWKSGDFPVDETRTSPDLGTIGVSSNPLVALAVRPHVHAVLGTDEVGQPSVGYAPNGLTATYKVTGTAWRFSVTMI